MFISWISKKFSINLEHLFPYVSPFSGSPAVSYITEMNRVQLRQQLIYGLYLQEDILRIKQNPIL